MQKIKILITGLSLFLLAGCNTPHQNTALSNTSPTTQKQPNQALGVDDAVQLALLNKQTQGTVSKQEQLRMTAETKKAYYNALAAQESVHYAKQVHQAAEAGAELARRMRAAGNFTPVQHLREKNFEAEATLELLRTKQTATSTHEKLVRLLGTSEPQAPFTLPDHLPDLPQQCLDVQNNAPEVREANQTYRSSYDIARRYRDEILPLKKRIGQENQLRYNSMQIGVFDLLADAREQISSVNSYIEALRDFWIAQAELDVALIGNASDNSDSRKAR